MRICGLDRAEKRKKGPFYSAHSQKNDRSSLTSMRSIHASRPSMSHGRGWICFNAFSMPYDRSFSRILATSMAPQSKILPANTPRKISNHFSLSCKPSMWSKRPRNRASDALFSINFSSSHGSTKPFMRKHESLISNNVLIVRSFCLETWVYFYSSVILILVFWGRPSYLFVSCLNVLINLL